MIIILLLPAVIFAAPTPQGNGYSNQQPPPWMQQQNTNQKTPTPWQQQTPVKQTNQNGNQVPTPWQQQTPVKQTNQRPQNGNQEPTPWQQQNQQNKWQPQQQHGWQPQQNQYQNTYQPQWQNQQNKQNQQPQQPSKPQQNGWQPSQPSQPQQQNPWNQQQPSKPAQQGFWQPQQSWPQQNNKKSDESNEITKPVQKPQQASYQTQQTKPQQPTPWQQNNQQQQQNQGYNQPAYWMPQQQQQQQQKQQSQPQRKPQQQRQKPQYSQQNQQPNNYWKEQPQQNQWPQTQEETNAWQHQQKQRASWKPAPQLEDDDKDDLVKSIWPAADESAESNEVEEVDSSEESDEDDDCESGQFQSVNGNGNQFKMCVNGVWVVKNCAPGTVFDQATTTCSTTPTDSYPPSAPFQWQPQPVWNNQQQQQPQKPSQTIWQQTNQYPSQPQQQWQQPKQPINTYWQVQPPAQPSNPPVQPSPSYQPWEQPAKEPAPSPTPAPTPAPTPEQPTPEPTPKNRPTKRPKFVMFPNKCHSGTRRAVAENEDAFEVCDNGEWVFMLCAPGTWFEREYMECTDGYGPAPSIPMPQKMVEEVMKKMIVCVCVFEADRWREIDNELEDEKVSYARKQEMSPSDDINLGDNMMASEMRLNVKDMRVDLDINANNGLNIRTINDIPVAVIQLGRNDMLESDKPTLDSMNAKRMNDISMFKQIPPPGLNQEMTVIPVQVRMTKLPDVENDNQKQNPNSPMLQIMLNQPYTTPDEIQNGNAMYQPIQNRNAMYQPNQNGNAMYKPGHTSGSDETSDENGIQAVYTMQYDNTDIMQQLHGQDMMMVEMNGKIHFVPADPSLWMHDVHEIVIVSVEKCKVGRTREDDNPENYQECIINPKGITMWIRRKCAPGSLYSPWTRNCGKYDPDYNNTDNIWVYDNGAEDSVEVGDSSEESVSVESLEDSGEDVMSNEDDESSEEINNGNGYGNGNFGYGPSYGHMSYQLNNNGNQGYGIQNNGISDNGNDDDSDETDVTGYGGPSNGFNGNDGNQGNSGYANNNNGNGYTNNNQKDNGNGQVIKTVRDKDGKKLTITFSLDGGY